MTTFEWLLVFLLLALAVVHIYFGIRYREFFVASKATANKSYWAMIGEFKQQNPQPGVFLTAVIWTQVAAVVALAISRVFS